VVDREGPCGRPSLLAAGLYIVIQRLDAEPRPTCGLAVGGLAGEGHGTEVHMEEGDALPKGLQEKAGQNAAGAAGRGVVQVGEGVFSCSRYSGK